MNSIAQFDQGSHGQVFVRGMVEDRASGSRSKHEGESSYALCDRLRRTRDFSQRQLPTDQDYAVSTREYQTDQSSLKPAPAAAGPVLEQRQKQRQQQKQHQECAGVDRVTPYQSTSPEGVECWVPHQTRKLGGHPRDVLVFVARMGDELPLQRSERCPRWTAQAEVSGRPPGPLP